jgi:hypothetical protein
MNFDYNVENYNRKELEEILGLPDNYDNILIENNSNKLKRNILNDSSLDENVKSKAVKFLNSTKELLTKSINKILEADIYNISRELNSSKTINEGNDYIIDKNATPFAMSFTSTFYPGKMNPLKKRTLTKSLNIDTRFRDNYYGSSSTNFNVVLPIKFSNILSMQVSSFEIPVTIYTISSKFGNNYLWLKATNNKGFKDEKLSIIVPDGNYLSTDFINYLNNYIITNKDFTNSVLLKYITFYLNISGNNNNSGSGQVVVGISSTYSNNLFNFSLNFQYDINGNPDHSTPLPLKMGWLMGFRQGDYEGNSNYVSEGIINITGPNYLYLVVDDYNNNVNNSFYSAFNSSILNKNILARITLQTACTFDVLLQNNLSLITPPREYFGPVDIQRLNIQLLDEYGRVIDLNNMDYSFCLNMQMIYDL